MKKADIIIIGGGAAGLMAAARVADMGLSVLIIERKYRCGLKLLITGKGRCNITNTFPWDEFSTHIYPDSSYLKTAFYSFSNTDTISFFNKLGLKTKEERGHRIFPESDRSEDVVKTLIAYLSKKGVTIHYNTEVTKIIYKEGTPLVLQAIESKGASEKSPVGLLMDHIYSASAVILATGGLSYSITGSNGSGYELASLLGHKIIPTSPSLTALKQYNMDDRLIGITLVNVKMTLIVNGNNVQSEFGEMTFTEGGIEGALGFRVSRRGVKALINGESVELSIDLKPAVPIEELSARITRELSALFEKKYYRKCREENRDKPIIKALLTSLLPMQIIDPFIDGVTGLTINNLPTKLKEWRFKIRGYVGYERAVVTAGGVSLKDISRKTMESKLIPGLYFAGEVMDLDGDTGGYNLQIAFSTANLAANSAAERIKNIKATLEEAQ